MSGTIGNLMKKKRLLDDKVAVSATQASRQPENQFLSKPVKPEASLQNFLYKALKSAIMYLPQESRNEPFTAPFCEIEARLGVLKIGERRVTSSGAKLVQGRPAKAFDCTPYKCGMLSGVSRAQFIRNTGGGTSEVSALSQALGVTKQEDLKRDIVEKLLVETVYTGYSNEGRLCYDGEHPSPEPSIGKMETKQKLLALDLTIPAANFDLRVAVSSEKILDHAVQEPPPGWKSKRIKRRRSYERRDGSIKWQIDVTEVTTIQGQDGATTIDYEVEMELFPAVLLKLLNEKNEAKLKQMISPLADQLWWILSQINPLVDVVDVEETLQDHTDAKAVQLALAQCGAFKRYMDSRGSAQYDSPIGKGTPPSAMLSNVKFVGCMPINFSRHNLEEIQRGADNAYYLSEKTDGVRHLMVFTGNTVVLVDRAMRGKQPIPTGPGDPFAPILDLIKPGTVFDGEVVMNRREGKKPRPIFIVFDVMAVSTTEPVLHLPFETRLRHLRRASFRTPTASRDMFDARFVSDPSVALPLVRKNFVKRSGVDDLLSKVVGERGMRCYRDGELHNHLTDGIIFQPNLPYVCGTDRNLLKWKYLDTVTVDIEILPLLPHDDDETLRVGCLGEEGTRVDMTRYVLLPRSERLRLEADMSASNGGKIAEIGFHPEMGEWYYLTMRSDKVTPNHISTVLGTLLELAENLSTDELRFRLNVRPGTRDTFFKDMRNMFRQLLSHQRKLLASQK